MTWSSGPDIGMIENPAEDSRIIAKRPPKPTHRFTPDPHRRSPQTWRNHLYSQCTYLGSQDNNDQLLPLGYRENNGRASSLIYVLRVWLLMPVPETRSDVVQMITKGRSQMGPTEANRDQHPGEWARRNG